MYVFGAILTGFLCSIISGMFGIGGSSTKIPPLRLFLNVPPDLAIGTVLPSVIPTALAGAVTYWRKGLVDFRMVLYCCSGGIAGSFAGAMLTWAIDKYWDVHYLMYLVGAIVLYLAGVTIYRGATGRKLEAEAEGHEFDTGESDDPRGSSKAPLWLLVTIGFAGGFASGLLGLGGGIVLVPCFLYILRLPIKRAFGTSLAVITIIAIPGTIVHTLAGNVSGWLLLYLIIGSVPGAYTGARISFKAGERLLHILFGVLLAAFGVVFIVNEIIQTVG